MGWRFLALDTNGRGDLGQMGSKSTRMTVAVVACEIVASSKLPDNSVLDIGPRNLGHAASTHGLGRPMLNALEALGTVAFVDTTSNREAIAQSIGVSNCMGMDTYNMILYRMIPTS